MEPIGFRADGKAKKARTKSRKKSDVNTGLTPRQRRYLSERLKGHNKKVSALLAGFSESMAENAASKIETPRMREAFEQLLETVIPDEKIALRLAEGLDATTMKFATCEGAITDFAECVDFDQRRKYLELAALMKKRYTRTERVESESVSFNVTVDL